MTDDELIADIKDYGRQRRLEACDQKARARAEAERLEEDVRSRAKDVAELVRLANACQENEVPLKCRLTTHVYLDTIDHTPELGYVIADGVSHQIGLICERKTRLAYAVGYIDRPSLVFTDTGALVISKRIDEYDPADVLKVHERAERSTYGPITSNKERNGMLRAFLRDFDPFAAAFRTYVRNFLGRKGATA